MKLLLAEYRQKEICDLLGIHPNTVCSAKTKIMEKWGVTTMVGFVKEGIKRKYLELDEDEGHDPYAHSRVGFSR